MTKPGSSGLRRIFGPSKDGSAEKPRQGSPSSELNLVLPVQEDETAEVQSGISPQAMRVIYEQLLADDPKVVNCPKLFLDGVLDLLIAAKKECPAEFHRVLRECRESEEARSPSQKLLIMQRLADWLTGVRFTKAKAGSAPEQDWVVLLCKQEDLQATAPKVMAVNRASECLENEMVSLYDVFSNIKIE